MGVWAGSQPRLATQSRCHRLSGIPWGGMGGGLLQLPEWRDPRKPPALRRKPAPSYTEHLALPSPSSSCRVGSVVPSSPTYGLTIKAADHNPPGSYTISVGAHTPDVGVHNPTRADTTPHRLHGARTTLRRCARPRTGAENVTGACTTLHTHTQPARVQIPTQAHTAVPGCAQHPASTHSRA